MNKIIGGYRYGYLGFSKFSSLLAFIRVYSRFQLPDLGSYISTRFFRFLVLLKKNTQNAPRGVYALVPLQDFSKPWADEKLYKKYGLTKEEIAFIESRVRPMEANNEEREVSR